ncbi:UNVERIFIED_CONTAM: hypothetical protein Slati_0545300 [Sesamum latifolium]|uniref:Uncharacterized protein n=1 Tax=Sesamum latifolium TaxID=2727402 RepID=A0AAW2Y0H3_9LAMI
MKPRFLPTFTFTVCALALYLITNSCTNKHLIFPASDFFYPLLKTTPFSDTFSTHTKIRDPPEATATADSRTNLGHLVFGLVGSEQAWHHRKEYIESWWRPNGTRGYLFLDKAPSPGLLPWPETSPPYRVSDDLKELLNKSEIRAQRMVHGIMEAFGGGGIILSYPLAKALARDMENCLKRYVFLIIPPGPAIGANLSPQKGNHQIDFRGDISGLLSSHPLSPLLSLHHFDMVEPIFPGTDRFEATRRLMQAAAADQARMLQQTICHHRQSNWSFSISWGYSAQIYERIMPRSYLQMPVETFKPWIRTPRPPNYLFNTRKPSRDPCEAPHAFFFESVERKTESDEILTSYSRAWPRDIPACSSSGNHSADYVQRVQVFSPANKRTQVSSLKYSYRKNAIYPSNIANV